MNKQERAEVINLIYRAIILGVTKSEIIRQLKEDEFGCVTSNLSMSTYTKYYKEAITRFEVDGEDKDYLRDVMLSRYNEIFQLAVLKKDYNTAKSILDSITKLTGINAPEKIDLSNFAFKINLD